MHRGKTKTGEEGGGGVPGTQDERKGLKNNNYRNYSWSGKMVWGWTKERGGERQAEDNRMLWPRGLCEGWLVSTQSSLQASPEG